jgi:RimJ/RimL family protein N-acetyltransferase
MMIRLRTLTTQDLLPLLAFERENRAWFEQFVEDRGDAFYTPEGVAQHIATYLEGLANGTWYPGLLVDQAGEIIGRTNLKDINTSDGSAELGYRLAKTQTGAGRATTAIALVKDIAHSQLGLKRLRAVVTQDNVASNRVLEKSGFVRMPADQLSANWMGTPLVQYQCELVGHGTSRTPMTSDFKIRAIERNDYSAWRLLWDGYNAFYGRSAATALPEQITEATWERFFRNEEPVYAQVAVNGDGSIVGIAHYLFHRSTTRLHDVCYLQDLFTADQQRGLGVARLLIQAVYDAAREAGSSRVYWTTQTSNVAGRALYDKVAKHLGFIVYSYEI